MSTTVYCCQTNIVWEDERANYDRARNLIAAARPERGSLVVLPEMFSTGFSMQAASIAADGGRETTQFLSSTAREHGVYILAGIAVLDHDRIGLNQAVAFDASGVEIARYSKM